MKQILFLSLLIGLHAQSQTPVPFDSPRWTIIADSAIREEHLGRASLKLHGAAWLKDADFTNGIIEFDIALAHDRYFPGMAFRMVDSADGEIYYLRPHQSGNPDAMQYYPSFHNSEGWQIYYGEGYNNAHVLPFDRWLHIRMVVSGSRAEIWFDNEKTPALYISALKRPVAAGMIVLRNGGPVPAWYANFSYTRMDSVSLVNPPRIVPALPSTVFTHWQVSDPFDESILPIATGSSPASPALQTNHTTTPRLIPDSLHWHPLETDERGVADLSRIVGVRKGKNTVFARLVIDSDRPQIKKLRFGFSDRVKVYFNGQLLYAGENNFQSRDYRFLGTIGYFDALYLNLKKGRNECWMAVSEDFGGWGVQASLEDPGLPPFRN